MYLSGRFMSISPKKYDCLLVQDPNGSVVGGSTNPNLRYEKPRRINIRPPSTLPNTLSWHAVCLSSPTNTPESQYAKRQ